MQILTKPNGSIVPSLPESKSPIYGYSRIKWTHYNPNEDFYAKFQFDYTSRAKLVKWGLCDEAGVPTGKGHEKYEHSHSVQFRTGNVSAGEGDTEQQQSGSLGRGVHGVQTENLVSSTEHTKTHIKGRGEGGEEEKETASLKREIARLEISAQTDADADAGAAGDGEEAQHKPVKRRHRTVRLPRTDQGERRGKELERHEEQRRRTISGDAGDVVDDLVPAKGDAT